MNINEIRCYNEDCIEGMKRIPDKSIDMILTDPPYGQTAGNKWDTVIPFDEMWKEFERIAKDNAAIVIFGNGMFTADLMQSNRKMWRYNLIWEKTQPSGFLNAKRQPMRAHEDICVFYKKQPIYNPQKTKGHKRKVSTAESKKGCKVTTDYGKHKLMSYDSTERYPRSVLKFSKDIQKSAIHPTQKPQELFAWLIRTYTEEGQTVLDPCAGSMTAAAAAIETRRKCICFEKEKSIFEAGMKRIETREE